MKKYRLEESVAHGEKSAPVPEIDYRPRTYSPREQAVFGMKLIGVIGIVLLTLCLYEVYLVK